MARTIAEIRQAIITDVENNTTLSTELTSTSSVAIWRLWVYVVSVAIWALEKLFDQHKSDIESIIAAMSPHRLNWYVAKAKAYQHGYSLLPDSDLYAETDDDAKIIQFAAATETTNNYLKIKVAKANGNTLDYLTGEWPNRGLSAPMTESSGGSGEKLAFYSYMERVKDAGVKLYFISREPDHLRLVIDAYYDPMVLDGSGQRLDGTNNTPLQDAINAYIENLPFNGEYSNMSLTDAMQAVDGIIIPQLLSAEAYWGEYEWEVISAKYTPEAGWLKVYEGDLTINWIAYGSNL